MRLLGYSGEFWPSTLHELLLQAALCRDERARPAWERARPMLDLPTLEAGCFDVLPLLYRRLRDWREDRGPVGSRLKGVYRKVWYANQLLLQQFRAPFAALHEASLVPLVFGAAAVAPTVYDELGLRRILYFEAMLPPGALPRALKVLEGAGVRLETPKAEVEWRRPLVFTSPRGLALSLHDEAPVEVLLPGRCSDSAAAFWASARTVDLQGTAALVPGAAESLFLACATGAKGSRCPSVDWIVDAATLAGRGIQWSRVAELAIERRVSRRVGEALRYLREALDVVEVPEQLVSELCEQRLTPRARIAHRLAGRTEGTLGGLPDALAVYLRLTDDQLLVLAVGFARHLQRHWGLPSLRHVPWRVARKAAAATLRVVIPRRPPRRAAQRRRSALSSGT